MGFFEGIFGGPKTPEDDKELENVVDTGPVTDKEEEEKEYIDNVETNEAGVAKPEDVQEAKNDLN